MVFGNIFVLILLGKVGLGVDNVVIDKFGAEFVVYFFGDSAVLFALVLFDAIAKVYFSVVHVFG